MSRRSRSMAPSGSRLALSAGPASLSGSSSHLNVSTSDVSGGGRRARAAPSLCEAHRPPQVCLQRPCPTLHLCRLFVEGFCPRGTHCRWGHTVLSPDNFDTLEEFQLTSLSERELFWLVRSLLRRTAPVTVEEFHQELALCPEYSAKARCEGDNCFRLHLCPHWVKGECSAAGCRWSHRLDDPDNVMVLLRLRCADMSEAEVLTQLARNKVDSLEKHGITTGESHHRNSGGTNGANRVKSLENTAMDRTHKSPSSDDAEDGLRGSGFAQSVGEQRLTANQASKTPVPRTVEEMKREALSLDICANNCFPSHCTQKDRCDKLHLCRFFVPGICTYAVFWCLKSHKLNTPHNIRVLRRHKLLELPEKDLLTALRAGYLARYPITDKERRFLVQMCRPYQKRKYNCQEGICTRIHVCNGYVEGTCEHSRVCGKSHDLNSPHNAAIVRRLGFPYSLTDSDMLEILRNPLNSSAVWKSWAHKKLRVPSAVVSGSVSMSVETRLRDEQTPNQDQKKQGTSLPKTETPKVSGSCSLEAVAALVGEEERMSSSSVKSDAQRSEAKSLLTENSSGHDGPFPPGVTQPSDLGSERSSDSHLVNSAKTSTLKSNEAQSHESSQAGSVFSLDSGPVLCAVHASGGVCSRDDCDGFHVCGYFLANLCRRPDDSCPFGHSFQSEHNMRMMQLHGLGSGSPEHFQTLLDDITLRARITFSNGSHQKVQMCIPYNSPGGCVKTGTCGRLHVCHRFLGGTCSVNGCSLRHNVAGGHNQCIRKSLGLSLASPEPGQIGVWATERDLIELLRARMGLKPGTYPIPVPEKSEQASKLGKAAVELKLVSELAPSATPLTKPFAEVAKSPSSSPAKKKVTLPTICRRHSSGLRCSDSGCASLHICPHFVASYCKRQNCALGHQLKTDHNQDVLRRSGYAHTPPKREPQLIKALYTGSPHIRRTEIYTKLRICITHNRTEGCGNSKCPSIHICQRFVAGSCHEQGCSLGHNADTASSRRKLQLVGLADASVNEVLELLRAIHGFRSCYTP